MNEQHDNDGKIPVSVLDRVIKLSQDNNNAYSQIVAALDSMSSRSMEMADAVDRLSKNIEDEQLATILKDCMTSIKADVQVMKNTVGVLAVPSYNLVSAIAACLEFDKATEQEVRNQAKAVLWFLNILGVFQRNKSLFLFLSGALLFAILGSAGVKFRDLLAFIVGHL